MRHGSSSRRGRGRGGNRSNTPNKNKVYDSSGPDVRIRGTAYQIAEKYETLSRDAIASGDVILAQSYLQHAEHYQRIISTWNEANEASQQKNTQTRAQPKDGNRIANEAEERELESA